MDGWMHEWMDAWMSFREFGLSKFCIFSKYALGFSKLGIEGS